VKPTYRWWTQLQDRDKFLVEVQERLEQAHQ
jgi:hypothetical protein